MTADLEVAEIPGHRYLQHLGSGGYAEVYLYEQAITGLKVAVKVLRAEAVDDALLKQFRAEAAVMATLADHPFIVAVTGADLTPDGRPYIAMRYYPGPNLAVRARREQFSVPDALRIGIQISSAVETAHRAGILHRDIKPHNILTGSYGEPGLADFGISAALTDRTSAATGMSYFYAPPEVVFGQSEGDVRADVYALGATLWHLLAGRPVHQEPGGDNSHYAVMRRIQSDPVPAVGREDVPDSLKRLLRQALAKLPDGRPQTALALARALQSIEQELRLPPTQIVVPERETSAPHSVVDDSEDPSNSTVVRAARIVPTQPGVAAAPDAAETIRRGPQTISPAAATPTPREGADDQQATRRGRAAGGTLEPQPERSPRATSTRVRASVLAEPAPDPTVHLARIAAPTEPEQVEASAPAKARGSLVAVAAACLLVLVVVGVAVLITGGGLSHRSSAAHGAPAVAPQDAVPQTAVAPGTPILTATAVDGRKNVRFSVSYTSPLRGDVIRYKQVGAPNPAGVTTSSTFVLPDPGKTFCVTVRVVRESGLASAESVPKCVR